MTHVMDRPINPSWWQKPRTKAALIAAGVILVLLLASLMLRGLSERSLRVTAADVTIATVARDTFHDFVPVHGEVTPKDTIDLDAQQGGQVAKILVQAGDYVTQGQPMIVFRNDQLQLEVLNDEGRLAESITQLQGQQNQLEATRAANESALATIRYQITSLEHTAARYDPLLKNGAIDAKTVQGVHDQLDYYRTLLPIQSEANARQEALRRQQLPGLQAEVASTKKSLEAIRGELDALTERAPITGKVTQLDLKIGQNRNRGEQLAEIVPPTGFKIGAQIDEYYLGRVKQGQYADIDLNGARYRLKVARVYPAVKSGSFAVDLDFAGAMPQGLSPGATAEGKLSLGGDSKAVVLAAGPFLEASGGDFVFVLDQGGKSAHRRRVKLGRRNAEQVEVLSGLSAGERVITSDYATYDKIDRIDLN